MPDNRMAGMLREIKASYAFTAFMTGKAALDEHVARAIQETPRHAFVPLAMEPSAYDNCPLSIGYGQTISQPFIVALMTDLLCPEKEQTILEIGTGCGYQTAILSRLVHQVYTIEIISSLAEQARERLQRLGYSNVEVKYSDGYYGWQEQAPFDGIIVTAAPEEIPPALTEQLKPGGRLVIPLGRPHQRQELVLLRKDENGVLDRKHILDVAFVPLTGIHDDRDKKNSA